MQEKPKLMSDSTRTDGKAEIVMDYILSWCLRRAGVNCSDEKPILYDYCRKMLGLLLDIEMVDNVVFKSVYTWKQSNDIDIWAEIEMECGGNVEYHALLIEDKYYSALHNKAGTDKNQLEVYKEAFDAYYDKKGAEWKRHYAVVTCLERESKNFEKFYGAAADYGFKVYSFYDMLGNKKQYIDSESDIFNEFWLRTW